jgi:hypothetical protein
MSRKRGLKSWQTTSDWYRVRRHKDGTFSLYPLNASMAPSRSASPAALARLLPPGKCQYEVTYLHSKLGTGKPHWNWWANAASQDALCKNIDTTRAFPSEEKARDDCSAVLAGLGIPVSRETTQVDIAIRSFLS